ncbi:peptidoglycan D,D-transpeptidase FtsI family protein [Paucibacter sp. DJ2R-2]|uniref:peptidoglycan D,D-transpeptidase FtsI family protein n=1 Tax=Paucibacter sp. DJ2R-2 TaxID=2893558 RepID=UPI0021E3C44F|nr:penicillin-binding protein 2 [Paucibacter sp. DJ2R-2]MCV2421820.1 penicillin-binding protein 2 [Paucibacter sp. DJ4R-1]MCV2439563.1 penicillin-binding protein 2 [Paucibacter sp. DJ2R-2]
MSWLRGGKKGGAGATQRPLPKTSTVRAQSARSVSYSTSPLLASKTPPWRSRFLVGLVGLAFAGLLGRALYVQVIGTEFYQKQGEARFVHTVELPASRGRINDRSGQVLAASVAVPSVWAIPKEVDEDPTKRRALAKILGISPAELERKLDPATRFVWLRRQAEDQVAADIKALGLKGVFQDREYKRKYPEGEAAAHVVGFTNIEERGQEGIELAFQKALQGKDGSRSVVRDRLGRVVDEDVGERVPAANGRDIDLSIDSKVQFFAYQRIRDAVAEHKAKAGSVVVLDVQSGEVLALANFPSYNPSERKNLSGAQLRNRAMTDIFEPGSTMKPFIAALALETGRVTPDTPIQTAPGSMIITGSKITDAHPHGLLTVAEVIQKSSNVGTVKMAMTMPAREMHEMFTAIGLGQRPQIDFPGAITGKLRPYKSWRPIEQATMSYGYGLSASLLQLARAYTVFARDGEVIPVTMLHQPGAEPVHGLKVFSPKTAQDVRQMLMAAAAPGGTAPLAMASGYSVGGKSGTAHKQEGKGYAGNKYRSWFVGLAPISKPRIIVAVMVDEPSNGVYYGGAVAGPVFSQVVSQSLRLLGVPTDLEVKPQIVASQGAGKPLASQAVEESF